MFKHLLVPIDLSTRNARILAVALGLAKRDRARVTLLHVIERVEGVPVGELQGFYRLLKKRARQRLGAAARKFAALGIDTVESVVIGTPARDIVKVAASDDIDLIVMGSHRLESPATPRAALGTTSHRVAILAPCPVLLVR
jgi:nucleotide-binding universal stress UspA family protein